MIFTCLKDLKQLNYSAGVNIFPVIQVLNENLILSVITDRATFECVPFCIFCFLICYISNMLLLLLFLHNLVVVVWR